MKLQSDEVDRTLNDALKAEFPKEKIHWRAQSLTKNPPYKAMALAYIDARDVMDRLDEVIGSANWQDRYEDTLNGVRSGIGIKIGDEWIWKWDAAQYTDIEGVKGGHSDALKRAGVHWGIARYLYDFSAAWVPCEAYESGGKMRFGKFTEDPWKYQNSAPEKTTAQKISEHKEQLKPETFDFWIKSWRTNENIPEDKFGTETQQKKLLKTLRQALKEESMGDPFKEEL